MSGWRKGFASVDEAVRGNLAFVSTPEIDLLTLNAEQNFDFSVIPAFVTAQALVSLFFACLIEITQQTGGAATTAPLLTLLSGATGIVPTNALATTLAQLNAGIAPSYAINFLPSPRKVDGLSTFVAAPLSAKVTTAGVGPTTLKGRVVLGFYIDRVGVLS